MHNRNSSALKKIVKPSHSQNDQSSFLSPKGLSPQIDFAQSLNFAPSRSTPNLDLFGLKSAFDNRQSAGQKSGLLPTISSTKPYKHPSGGTSGHPLLSDRGQSRSVAFDNKEISKYKSNLESKYSHIINTPSPVPFQKFENPKVPIDSAPIIRKPTQAKAIDFRIPIPTESPELPYHPERNNNFPVAKSILKRAKNFERR